MRLPHVMFAALALAGCTKAEPSRSAQPGPGPSPGAAAPVAVDVALAGVTLADDCPDPDPAPAAAADAPASSVAPAAPITAAKRAPGAAQEPASARRMAPVCEQTTMQLKLVSRGAAATPVRVVRVEWMDASGASLGELTARAPTQWQDGGYAAWDQTLAPGATLVAGYKLSAPAWAKLEGGRWGAQGKTFQLRVTVATGAAERTVELQATMPAHIDPPVAT